MERYCRKKTFNVVLVAVLLAAALLIVLTLFLGCKDPADESNEGLQPTITSENVPQANDTLGNTQLVPAGKPPESLPMDRANPGRTGNYDSAAVSELEELKWQFSEVLPEEQGLSTPVVAGDTVFIAGEIADPDLGSRSFSGLLAIDAEKGKVKWRHIAAPDFYFEPQQAAPAVAGGVAYYGTLASDRLFAVDIQTGQELWSFQMQQHGAVLASPLVVDDVVYLPGGDNLFYAINAADGTEKWRFKTSGNNMSAAAMAGDLIFFGSTDGNLYALDAATGSESWRFAAGCPINATPTAEGGMVYATCDDASLFAIDMATGTKKWEYRRGDAAWSEPVAVADGKVFTGIATASEDAAARAGALVALKADDGTEIWSFQTEKPPSPPSIASGIVYFSSGRTFYALDASTGEEYWDFNADLFRTSAAVANGVVYLADFNGTVFALE